MSAIDMARRLGEEIQADTRFINFMQAKTRNDEDTELQKNIAEFGRLRESLKEELSKEDKDEALKEQISSDLKVIYAKIMTSPGMQEYNRAKQELEALRGEIDSIISQCFAGADPQTCEPQNCSGSCSTCGGCS